MQQLGRDLRSNLARERSSDDFIPSASFRRRAAGDGDQL
jgi:hypothetical protein